MENGALSQAMALGFMLAGMAGPMCGASRKTSYGNFEGLRVNGYETGGYVTHMYLGTLVKAGLLFGSCLCLLIQTAHIADPHRDGGLFACSFTKGPKSMTAASGPAVPMAHRWAQPFFAVPDRQTVRLIEACDAVASRRRRPYRAYPHRT